MKGKKTKFLAVLSAFAMSLAACGVIENGNNGGGTGTDITPTPIPTPVTNKAPVYQGMTISRASEFNSANSGNEKAFGARALPRYLGDGEEGEGQEDINPSEGEENPGEDIPGEDVPGEENPSEENPEPVEDVYDDHTSEGKEDHDNIIETDIAHLVEIEVHTDEEVRYYVKPNEAFILQVHLSNPGLFEIQSFTLNGKKYANYMFEKGSDMENLLLEVTAPATPGYTSYTIDAIKYIDGTEIKDVDLSTGNQSVRAGITYENGPVAAITKQNLSSTTASFDIVVTDPEFLIGGNEIKCYVSDGQQILAEQQFFVGSNHIEVPNLIMSTTYQIGVSAIFDQVDGRDVHQDWIMKEEFTTPGSFSLENPVASKTEITFDVTRNDPVGQIDSVSLYDALDGKLIEKKGPSERSFSNLLSDHPYDLYLDFSYTSGDVEYKDWVVIRGIQTLAKVVPTLKTSDITATKDDISYVVEFEDVDYVCNIDSVELYRDGEKVDSKETQSGLFTGVYSDNTYVVRVNYSYDLNDGDGPVSKFIEQTVRTLAKSVPSYTFSNYSVGTDYITYEIKNVDNDGVSQIKSVDLYKNGEVVATNDGKFVNRFDGLLSESTYTIRVNYSYDLNNGTGAIDKNIEKSAKTLSRTAPYLTFTGTSADQSSVSYEISKVDESGICNIKRVELLRDGIVVATNDGGLQGTFNELLSDNKYTVRVVYDYDLNTGAGPVEKSIEESLTTLKKVKPTLTFVDYDADYDTVSYELDNVDVDGICDIQKVELIRKNEVVATKGGELSGTFENVLSNNDYTIRVTYSYDINDGRGNITTILEEDVTTRAKEAPKLKFDSIASDKKSVSYSVEYTDRSEVGQVTEVALFADGEKVASNGALLEGTFENLLSNKSYSVRVYYSYDVNEGDGLVSKFIEKEVKTVAISSPVYSLSDFYSDESSVSAKIEVRDPDEVSTITNVALYKDGEKIVENLSKQVNFSQLDVFTDYTVVISYAYDANDGLGLVEDKLSYNFTTSPVLEFESCNIANTSAVSEGDAIYFQANINNPYGATFTSVVIDGVKYSVDNSSTNSKLYANIINDGQFGGGEREITITGLFATLDGHEYFVNIDENNSATVFVNGALSIKEVYAVDENNERIDVDYLLPNEEAFLAVEFDNESEYEIYNIKAQIEGNNLEFEDFTQLDNNNYVLPTHVWLYEGASGNLTSYITSVSYRNDTIDKTITTNRNNSLMIYRLNSTEVVEISTPEQLKHMDGNCFYKLVNDIDLSGLEWEGGNFYGVFDGQGHSIKNMSVVTTFEQQAYLGLFRQARGVIDNLVIEDVTFLITTSTYYYTGALAASAYNLIVNNVSVTGDSLTSIISTYTESYSTYVGGLVGYAGDFMRFNNCTNNMNLSGSGNNGGIVGYFNGRELSMVNCENYGKISARYAGGLIGRTDLYNDGSLGTIENCHNHGEISAFGSVENYWEQYSGGIAGYLSANNSSSWSVVGCSNDANITGTRYVGGLFGRSQRINVVDSENTGIITASYDSCGGLAGYVENSTFSNCASKGDVNGKSYTGGLFGQFFNSKFDNCEIDCKISGTNYVGSVAGTARGTTINGLTNNADISGSEYIGGFFGEAHNTTMIDCVNNGEIKGTTNVGGFAGFLDEGTKLTGCVNNGTIDGNNYVGGFVGRIQFNNEAEYIFADLVNNGDVSSRDRVGGLVGYFEKYWDSNPSNYSFSITNCYNTATIQSEYTVGGLIGHMVYFSSEDSVITGCDNYGKVQATNGYAGGLFGNIDRIVENKEDQTYGDITISKCSNHGEIYGDYCGGLFAQCDKATIIDSHNYGRIFSTGYAGGLLAFYYGGSKGGKVLDCTNNADVVGNNNVGGLFGYVENVDFTGSTNSGAVTGSRGVGSLIGYACNMTLKDYVNTISIEGVDNVGGIFGVSYGVTFINCENRATITATGNAAGGLTGYASGCTFTNCSNSGEINGYQFVGGLFGQMNVASSNSITTISNCSNDGAIIAEGSYAGGLFGGTQNDYYMDSLPNRALIIADSVNNAIIVGKDYIGGLFGSARFVDIVDSFNLGELEGSSYIGSLGGEVQYASFSEINNEQNITGSNFVGGLFGRGYQVTFENCSNIGKINGNNYVGGLVGGGSRLTFIGCTNQASITAKKDYVGGLTGISEEEFVIEGCRNRGEVSGRDYVGGLIGRTSKGSLSESSNEKAVTGRSYVGGLVGRVEYNYNVIVEFDIVDCSNKGSVKGSNQVGGLIGELYLYSWNSDNSSEDEVELSITGNTNSGDVTGNNTVGGLIGNTNFQNNGNSVVSFIVSGNSNKGVVSGSSYLGGLFGNVNIYNFLRVEITSNYNNGEIKEESGTNYGNYKGGVFGSVNIGFSGENDNSQSTQTITYEYVIKDCVNYSDVSGYGSVGGVFGYVGGTSTMSIKVEQCINNGNVTGFDSVGGLIGNASYISLKECSNTGAVTGRGSNAGGLAGSINRSEVKDCTSTGKVTGGSTVGGFFGSINNMTVEGLTNTSIVTSTGSSVGGIVGYAENSTIINCSNEKEIDVANSNYVGGIAGYISRTNVTGCINHSNITGNNYVGGLFGKVSDDWYNQNNSDQPTYTISDSVNNGNITGDENIGGLVGMLGTYYTLENCTNHGKVNGRYNVGGIAGRIYYAEVTDCDSDGDVSGTSNNVGGLAGYVNNSTISNCVISGKVSGYEYVGFYFGSLDNCTIKGLTNNNNITSTGGPVGGIAGGAYRTTFEECVNNGEIIARNSAGGIVGYVGEHCVFIKCSNNASVTVTEGSAGGIAGNGRYSEYKECMNQGAITGSNDGIGGIEGRDENWGNNGEVSKFTDCENLGNITSRNGDGAGGIVGNAIQYMEISGCSNAGTIKGNNSIGGIAGHFNGNVTVSDCRNSGNIEAEYGNAGGIAGYAYNSTIARCHNSGDINARYSGASIVGEGGELVITNCSNIGTITLTEDWYGEYLNKEFIGVNNNSNTVSECRHGE